TAGAAAGPAQSGNRISRLLPRRCSGATSARTAGHGCADTMITTTGFRRVWLQSNFRLLALALALPFVLPLTACSGGDADGEAAADSAVVVLQPTDVATAHIEELSEGVVLTGTLNPYRIAEVRAQVPGLVSSIRVDRGDGVSTGQVMAVPDAQGIRSRAAGRHAQVGAGEGEDDHARPRAACALR